MKRGVALALMLGVSVAHAAGLGKLTVNSALGQPLNAEIDLVSLQPGEIDGVSAHVAPPEAFRDARIEYAPSVRLLRFAVDKRANGQPYLKVTSIAPINEPFVDVLIEVTWPAGRIQREYPILLDPPGYAQAKVAAPTVAAAAPARAETPPAPAPAVSSPAPAPAAEPAAAGAPSAKAEMAAAKPAAGAAGGSDTYGPVQKGDTLNKIAESVKPSSVSLEQMLVALYRENKSAFVNNNMNRLKTGQILKVPAEEDVGKIESKEANREYRTHVADWKAYREQLASGVAAIPARPESTNAASGRVASAAVTPPAPPAAASGDVLKLSKTEAGKAGPGAARGGGGQERLNALQEEVTAKDKALKEAQSRVADLEKQIRDMQRLMDLKAGAAGKEAPKVAAVPPAPTKAVEAPKPAEAPKVAEAPKAPEAKPAEAPKTAAAEAPKPAEAAKPAEAPKPPETVAKAPETPKPAAPKKVVAPPPSPSLLDDLTDNPMVLAGLGGAVVLAGLGGLLFMRRRRAAAEEPTPSQMTSSFPSDLKPATGPGKPASGLVDTGNSSFLTDFDKTGPGTIDTDEVDPVAEAEVYIAYGRDAQAEEILKEAMARDKNRHEIALKLLEIYHARKSATAFETVAKELRGAVGDSSPMWQKAAAMGAQIDPNNPLYGAAAGSAATFTAMAPAAPAPKPDLDFDIAGSSNAPASPSFDLNLDAEKPAHAAPASSLDFNLETSSFAKPVMDVPAEPAREEKPAFDFDLSGLDLPGTPKKSAAPDLDLGESKPSLDLGSLGLEPAAAEGGEGAGTKLELAKAYLEIGDKDGAREILQEVAKEGSGPQKAEAQKLMATL
ncbi:MAG TPA: FimV/HubP family polar landmark protein [Usitatibacter sp.]|nr:FimV/HubP family polar landmark protein [Usitatibacter sp.]